jgi:Domain of unknown function (DUF3576)
MIGMNISKHMTAITVALAVSVGGCSGDYSTADHQNAHQGYDNKSEGYITGGNGGLFNFGTGNDKPAAEQNSGLAVNAYLWRGALETLKFMPLSSADPFGGVIITDWWTPPSSPGERFKATAYVVSRQLRADGIRVSLFRQVQQNGQWVDAPVDPAKPGDLENMVLAKARELRTQSASGS